MEGLSQGLEIWMKIDLHKVKFQKTGGKRIPKKFLEKKKPLKDHKEELGVRKTLNFSVAVLEVRRP